MSSYIYRERERDREWDEPRSSTVSIKRYVIPSEEDREREIVYRREAPVTGDRELVIRRSTEREEPVMVQRYEREIDYDTRPYDYRSERDYYDGEYQCSNLGRVNLTLIKQREGPSLFIPVNLTTRLSTGPR